MGTVSVAAFRSRHGAGACDCRCRGDEADSEDCCSHAADGREEEVCEEEAGEEEGCEVAEKGQEEEEREEASLPGRQAQEGPAQEQGCGRGGEEEGGEDEGFGEGHLQGPHAQLLWRPSRARAR